MSWLLDLILRRVRERIKLKLSLWLVLSGNVGLLSCHRFQTIRTPTSSGIFTLENPSPYPLPFQKKERGRTRCLVCQNFYLLDGDRFPDGTLLGFEFGCR